MTALTPDPLTLPGDIPGLLRRGSPVLYRDECSGWAVLCVEGDEVCAAPVGGVPLGLWGMSDDFALDLSDPTGRAHAAWWLCGRTHQPETQATWAPASPRNEGEQRTTRPAWVLTPARGINGQSCWSMTFLRDTVGDLNPDDDRRLPDGSRWVDAEALRRVVLHVAGRTE